MKALLVYGDGRTVPVPWLGSQWIQHEGSFFRGYEIAHSRIDKKGQPADGTVVYVQCPNHRFGIG